MSAAQPKDIFTPLEILPGKAECIKTLWPEGMRTYIPFSPTFMKTGRAPAHEDDIAVLGRFPGGDFALVWFEDGDVVCGFDVDDWVAALHGETYRPEHSRPLTASLPFHYHRVPGPLRNALAGLVLSFRGRASRSAHPVTPHNVGCAIVLRLLRGAHQAERTVVLTHDCDTAQGVDRMREVAAMEEALGWYSTWNIVPGAYEPDEDVLFALREAGHEIGQHGVTHDNGEAFLSSEGFREELLRHAGFRGRHDVRGYRGPCWLRTRAMFDVLAEFFEYDMTCLDNDFCCPAGLGGVGEVWPFSLRDELVEVPCTIPFEAPLMTASVRPEALVSWWLPKVEALSRLGGMVVVNTHPDPNYLGRREVREAYREFLNILAESGWSCRLACDVARTAL